MQYCSSIIYFIFNFGVKLKNNKFQIGDKVRWYSDQEGELTGVIVDSHKAGPVDKPRISYDIKIKNKTYKVIETALDRIPMTDLRYKAWWYHSTHLIGKFRVI